MHRIHNALTAGCGLLILLSMIAAAPTLAQEGLYVVEDKVGVGTETPEATLEIEGTTGTTRLLVDENSGTAQLRNLILLENRGPARIQFSDMSNSKTWRVGQYFGNAFRFDTPSGSGVEMELKQNGDLTLSGTMSQGSSRTFKTDIAPVDPRRILERVQSLPIAHWSYKHGTARHIGPMAEDFRASFGLGPDAKHLAPADTAGVALAAIQGLNEVLTSERERVASLAEENARLKADVSRMAATQARLLERLEALEDARD